MDLLRYVGDAVRSDANKRFKQTFESYPTMRQRCSCRTLNRRLAAAGPIPARNRRSGGAARAQLGQRPSSARRDCRRKSGRPPAAATPFATSRALMGCNTGTARAVGLCETDGVRPVVASAAHRAKAGWDGVHRPGGHSRGWNRNARESWRPRGRGDRYARLADLGKRRQGTAHAGIGRSPRHRCLRTAAS